MKTIKAHHHTTTMKTQRNKQWYDEVTMSGEPTRNDHGHTENSNHATTVAVLKVLKKACLPHAFLQRAGPETAVPQCTPVRPSRGPTRTPALTHTHTPTHQHTHTHQHTTHTHTHTHTTYTHRDTNTHYTDTHTHTDTQHARQWADS
jgi:hypothetical protein